jgi:lipoyl synthase
VRINVSLGTAAVLGLARTAMAAAPTTAYLMLGGRCVMDCAFCAQARESRAGALNLSRVTWPEYDLEDVLARLPAVVASGAILRVCLQVTLTDRSFREAMGVLLAVKGVCEVPFDVALLPLNLEQVRRLVEAGADHIGFGLDAASAQVFDRVKGGNWARHIALVENTARAFPGRAAVHLIVGLGETEQEMAERIQWAHDLGAAVGLFAFTPVRGTHLANLAPPPLAAYRRMQMARWLIVHELARWEEMAFDESGVLTAFGVPLPGDGQAFRTSGCPGCNRPFYNEQPGGPLYNYPWPLSTAEAEGALAEMEVHGVVRG